MEEDDKDDLIRGGGLIWKSVDNLQIWLKSDKDIGHFTWRAQYVYIDGTTKYFADWQQSKLYPQ